MTGSEVAYHLRVNKFIDRSLFVEGLNLIGRYVPLEQYGYVSMAGAYLEDCRVLHQTTRISRMYSFDNSASVIARQHVNRPFGFIQCRQQTSREVVEDFGRVRLALGGPELNVVVWLDYTSPSDRHSQLQELATLVPSLIVGDVLRITVNAHRPTLGSNADYNSLPVDQRPLTLAEWRHEKLKLQLAEYLPANRDDHSFMETNEGFYKTIIRSVEGVIVGVLKSRPELMAFPVLSTAYDDTHGMVTVTCLILRNDDQEDFVNATRWSNWKYQPGAEWDTFVEIRVPHLSMKERHVLHGAISIGGIFGGAHPPFVTAVELEQYKTHYLRYPTFAPLDIL